MERRMKISPKLLVIVAVILAAVIGIAAWLNNSNAGSTASDGSTVTVMVDGKEKAAYSVKEIMDMNETTVYAELQSSKGKDDKGDFTGVMLDKLLKTAGVNKYKTVILTAGDGYSSAAKAKESQSILIAYAKDHDTLGYYTKGGTGPLRCVFTEDTYGNRSVQYLTKINCISE